MQIEVNAQKRTKQGTGASRRLRREGKTPGIVYGGNQPAVVIELDHNALYHQLREEAFHASVLTLNLEGAKEQVLLRSVNMHPFRVEVQHIDFQRVQADVKIQMKVPLHFINAEICPGVKTGGGVVNHVMNEIDIQCLPDDLPEFIVVNLEQLELGHSMRLGEVPLPAGVEAIARLKKENPAIVSVQVPKAIVIEEEVAAPVTEIIGEVPAEGEEAAAAEGKEGEKGEKKEPVADKKEAGKKEPAKKE